jgi:hypothetical protein
MSLKGTFRIAAVVCVCAWPGLAASTSAQQLSITTFDVPASNGYGTQPVGINFTGAIAGVYADSNQVNHGFVRSPDGNFTTFDAPGAGTNPNADNGTFPTGINQFGAVAGYLNDSSNVSYGFVRSADGKFTVFSAPGADTNPTDALGTIVTGINDFGATSGYYFDTTPQHMTHGFFRSPGGQFTSFDPPGSIGTYTDGPLNLEGAIVGWYLDSNLLFHAFERYPNGMIATFVGPNSCNTGYPTGCYGQGGYNINIFGWSVGAYEDNSGNFVGHGFLRSPAGIITAFEPTGAGDGPYQGFTWNQIAGLNDWGAVTAGYLDANSVNHGFLRSPDGQFRNIDVPAAYTAPGSNSGTFPVGINDLGVIAGFYTDENYTDHGFVAVPCYQGCFGKDEPTKPATGVSPAATPNQASPRFPGALNPKLRLMPWYRNAGAQPPK